ncbi:MAG: LacI family DNA-binding transcriptional regulator [Candidatus Sumerlaeota bacterium]|nr:LacI family DNA-binding transcriptional regulator [Candidatus Sumerlaeota bacterium]
MAKPNHRITHKDIARIVGVDRSTVSMALNDNKRIAPRTRQRIRQVAEQVDYSPHYLARGLKGQPTQSVGLLVPILKDQFYVDVLAAMEQWLQEHGFSSLLAVTHHNGEPGSEVKTLRSLLNRFADGIACVGIGADPACQEELAALVRQGARMALYGDFYSPSTFKGLKVDFAVCHIAQACYEMTRHLLGLNHRRIALIGFSERKMEGCLRALREFEVAPDPRLAIPLHFQYQPLNELRKELMSLQKPPTAIFCNTDDLAAELMTELLDAGYRVPEDVAIAGVNDSWHSRMLRVPLTTIRLPTARIGEALAQMVVERIENPALEGRVREFPVEIIKRESTGST